MMSSKEFIDSGILEQYVLGMATPVECEEVERMASADVAIREEIEAISIAMQTYATEIGIKPDPTVKPFLMATIDYTERLKNGEQPAAPPLLQAGASITDYAQWLEREDMIASETEDIFAKIIGYNQEALTALVWLKDSAPHEVHDDEHERFLVVEGSCEIIIENKVNKLGPGEYFAIPLHKSHTVKVTSSIRCKVILQRVAA